MLHLYNDIAKHLAAKGVIVINVFLFNANAVPAHAEARPGRLLGGFLIARS